MMGFIALYVMIRIGYHLPALTHGLSQLKGERGSTLTWMQRLPDILLGFGFTLAPYLLLDYFYPRKRYLTASFLIILAVCVIFLVNYAYIRAVSPDPIRMKHYFTNNLFFISTYFLYGCLFYFLRFAHESALQQKELIIQNREAELTALRGQVNPHFLFNQLHTIYALVYQGSPQALPAISGLSDILRYTLYENEEWVPLEKEVVYVEKYIELQQLRTGNGLNAALQVSGETYSIHIAPMLLLPFLENAFKHGSGQVAVKLCISDKQIHFSTANGFKDRQPVRPGGLGIANVRKRLELLYPGKHRLEILKSEHQYTVNLYIERT
jgi:sensor histidine kinase YesM